MPATPAPDYDRSYLAAPTAERADVVAWQIFRILTGGQPVADSPYDIREIKLLYSQVMQEMQGEVNRLNAERLYKDTIERTAFDKAQYFDDMKAIYEYGGTSDDHLVTVYNWPVLFDANQGVYYSLLPEGWLNLKRYRQLPGEEIPRSVTPMKVQDRRKRRYIPLQGGQQNLVEGLQGNLGYYIAGATGERIEYYYDPEIDFPDTQVKIERILRPDRDTLPTPGLMQDAQDDMAIPKVVALIMRKAPADTKNDANPNL
jgi:hypothetical protein